MYLTGQKSWSLAYHVVAHGTVVLTIAVGSIVPFPGARFQRLWRKDTWATILASVAAALSSIALSGAFQRKWPTNRIDRGRLEALWIDLQAPWAGLAEIRKRPKEIFQSHDEGVVGPASEGRGVRPALAKRRPPAGLGQGSQPK